MVLASRIVAQRERVSGLGDMFSAIVLTSLDVVNAFGVTSIRVHLAKVHIVRSYSLVKHHGPACLQQLR